MKKKGEGVPDFAKEASSMECICLCKVKPNVGDKLLKCHNDKCSSGKFFHLHCMLYKRYPNFYKSSWLCSNCKLDSICSKKSVKPPSEASENSPLDDVVYLGTTMLSEGDVDKYSIIAELTSHDYDVIESPTGWLENTVIQQAHVLLKKVNPSIQGLQRTSLGVFCNFDQVDGDFIQILHTHAGSAEELKQHLGDDCLFSKCQQTTAKMFKMAEKPEQKYFTSDEVLQNILVNEVDLSDDEHV